MTDIEKMAREIGVEFSGKLAFKSGTSILATRQEWEAFAQAVALRCAEICAEHAADREPPHKAHENTYVNGWLDASNECNWAIRAEFGIREEP